MKTKRSIMLVERSVKTGRIAKNEEYDLVEFAKIATPRMVDSTTWIDRLFRWKTLKNHMRQSYQDSLLTVINVMIDNDNFGRKRK